MNYRELRFWALIVIHWLLSLLAIDSRRRAVLSEFLLFVWLSSDIWD